MTTMKGYETEIVSNETGFVLFVRELGKQLNTSKMFAGQHRVETLTDVKYVNSNLIVVGHRDQKLLYLIQIDRAQKRAQVIDRLYLMFQGQPRNVTLFCIEGNTIYLTFLTRYIGVVAIENNRLVKKGMLLMPDPVQEYHGVNKVGDIMYLTGAMINPKLVVYNMRTQESKVIQLPGLEGVNIKQSQLLGDYIVVSAASGHISDDNLYHNYDGYIGVYRKDTYEKVDLVKLPTSQMDDIRVYKDSIFCIRQGSDDYGQALQYKLENEKLVRVKEYRVGRFPHGIDIRDGIVACTSMKDSSIAFFPA
jgi:hypothetical protein